MRFNIRLAIRTKNKPYNIHVEHFEMSTKTLEEFLAKRTQYIQGLIDKGWVIMSLKLKEI